MVKQLNSIPIILRGLGQACHIYAADILHQLYRHKNGLSLDDIIVFFRNRNRVQIWEAVAGLQEIGLIESTAAQNWHEFKITDKGIEKVHMILACFGMRVHTQE